MSANKKPFDSYEFGGQMAALGHLWLDRYGPSSKQLLGKRLLYLFLSLCGPVCLSACQSVCVSVCLSVCLSVCCSLSVCLSVCLSVALSVCTSVCLSVYLSVCVFACSSASLACMTSVAQIGAVRRLDVPGSSRLILATSAADKQPKQQQINQTQTANLEPGGSTFLST